MTAQRCRTGLTQIMVSAAGLWILIGQGQELRGQDKDTGCPPCEIRIETVTTLRSSETAMEPRFDFTPSITQDSRGWYYLAPMTDMRSIGVYQPSGRFERVIADSGEDGPLFRYVTEVKMRNDTLIAVDRGDMELDLIPLGGDAPAQVSLGYRPEGVLPLSDGKYLTQLDIRTPQMVGLPVHLHGPDGEHLRSFGRSSDRVPDAPYDVKRNIAYGANGSILLTRVNQYRIEIWTLDGRLVDVIEKERSWFAPWRDMPRNPRTTRPPTWFDSVRFEENGGLLWCVFHVPDQDWAADRAEEDVSPTLVERHEVFDTMVEVLELSTGRVLASKRFDRHISGYLNDGRNLYATMREDDQGNRSVELLRLTLSRGSADPEDQ